MLKTLFFTLLTFLCLAGFAQEDSVKKNIIPVEVSRATWKKVTKALADVDPKYYKIEYVKNNEFVGKGSADLNRLEAVSIIGSGGLSFSTGNMIQVVAMARGGSNNVEYIKLIWITGAISDIAAKVDEVNAILKGEGN